MQTRPPTVHPQLPQGRGRAPLRLAPAAGFGSSAAVAEPADTPLPRKRGRSFARGVFLLALPPLAIALLPFWSDAHWTFDLASHFALPCMAALLGAAALMLLCLRVRSAVLLVAAASLPAYALAPLYLPSATGGLRADSPRLRVAIANAYVGNRSPQRLRAWIEQEDPDAFAVLEYTTEHQRTLAPLHGRYPHRMEAVEESPFGIALFSKLPLLEQRTTSLGAPFSTALFAVVEWNGARLALMAAHPPPPISRDYARMRDQGLAQLVAEAARMPPDRILLADCNATRWSRPLREAMAVLGLRDSAEGLGFQGSWPARLPWPLRIPIDHVLVSDGIAVTRRELGPDVGSAHLPVVAEIAIVDGRAHVAQPPSRR